MLRVGTLSDCEKHLDKILDSLDYEDPKVLNGVPGWPEGRPHTAEHIANAAAKRPITHLGNGFALGAVGSNIDVGPIMGPAGSKLKWFHNPEATAERVIVVDANNKPIDPKYAEWIIGKINRRSSYAQQRLDAIRAEHKEEKEKAKNE